MTDKNMFIKIPYPKEIPAFNITRVEGYPGALTDYYILDLYMTSVDTSIAIAKTSLADLIPTIGNIILSEPIFVGRESTYEFFACTNEHGELIVMQSKYYQYFKVKYHGCYFTSAGKLSPIGVKHGGGIVGLFMPLQLTKELYDKLCHNMEVPVAV
jgi:hypothetical protein